MLSLLHDLVRKIIFLLRNFIDVYVPYSVPRRTDSKGPRSTPNPLFSLVYNSLVYNFSSFTIVVFYDCFLEFMSLLHASTQ